MASKTFDTRKIPGGRADGMPDERPDYLASLRLVAGFLGASRTRLAGTLVLATAGVACELVPVWTVYRASVDVIAGAVTWAGILQLAGLAFVATLTGSLLKGFAAASAHVVAFDIIYELRFALARHMARVPLGALAASVSGDAKTLVVDEPEKLELVIAHGLPEGASAITTWAAVTIWLFAVDARMALASVVAAPVSMLLLVVAMRRAGRRAGAYREAQRGMNAAIVESIDGMQVVKMFDRTGERLTTARMTVRRHAEIQMAWARDYLPLGGTVFSLVLANMVFIVPTGAFLMAAGTLDLPTFVFFVVLGANYSAPLLKLFNQFHEFAQISMGAMSVAALLRMPLQSDPGERGRVPEYHDVAFENVCFSHDETPILRGVDFVARQGCVTALVGPSGSGKSTIASLIVRSHDVEAGRVTIGGVDLREIALDRLMEEVAFVFQDTFLFSDTIAANIRFGKPGAGDDEVEAAARAARAHAFIAALPDGYGTRLGARGANLSGGERQRIAIARAILKNAPIVVLDEATAFADPDNERAIQQAIKALTETRTVILIAHRLHTIVNCDQIVVVDRGCIRETGRHDELVARAGLYARLWDDYTAVRSMSLRGPDLARSGEAVR